MGKRLYIVRSIFKCSNSGTISLFEPVNSGFVALDFDNAAARPYLTCISRKLGFDLCNEVVEDCAMGSVTKLSKHVNAIRHRKFPTPLAYFLITYKLNKVPL